MNNAFNKKLTEMLGKMDDKVFKSKLNNALDMLKSGDTDDLAKKLGKVDKNELMQKMNELDEEKLKELNIDKNEISKKINNADLQKLSELIGEHGDEIVKKIKDIIK